MKHIRALNEVSIFRLAWVDVNGFIFEILNIDHDKIGNRSLFGIAFGRFGWNPHYFIFDFLFIHIIYYNR